MLLIPKGIQADNILTTDKVQFLDTSLNSHAGALTNIRRLCPLY
jgi:hypothetical protein